MLVAGVIQRRDVIGRPATASQGVVADHAVREAVREIVEVDLDGGYDLEILPIRRRRRRRNGGPIGKVKEEIGIELGSGTGEVEDVEEGVNGKHDADRGQGFLRQRDFPSHCCRKLEDKGKG